MTPWSLTPHNRERHFLVVEDERDIAELLALHLSDLQAEVTVVHDGDEALKLALGQHWDLILLDLRLPGTDGLDICRQLRARADYVPILMLTSRSTELDRVLGLELGADDYLVKPFSLVEVQARVKALLRRAEQARQPASTETVIERAGLRLDQRRRTAVQGDRELELTAREFDLLWFFASHPGRVFRRAELLDQVWGYGHEGYEHTVNSHITRLRAKIEPDTSRPHLIQTVWGVGYRFTDAS
ncbi:MAG: response regulator transcription factor [Candidatus Competibacterales bacterium]|nr:response regulator transcription factor [Candidatus Competibacterales bacterium]